MLARQLKMLMITKQAVTEASCASLKHKLAMIPLNLLLWPAGTL